MSVSSTVMNTIWMWLANAGQIRLCIGDKRKKGTVFASFGVFPKRALECIFGSGTVLAS